MARKSKQTLAKTIRAARDAAELTQQEAAEASGIYQAEFSMFEAGTRIPSTERLAMIAHGLRTTLSELCRGVDASLLG